MSEKRRKLSGAAYKKKAHEKQEKQNKVLLNVPKLETFFNKTEKEKLCHTELTEETEVEEKQISVADDVDKNGNLYNLYYISK